MKKIFTLFILCALHSALCTSLSAQNQFTVAALNVDGMPKSVKILGVADINLNPDAKEAAGAKAIGQKLVTMGYDIVALEENFNFNQQIMAEVGSTFAEGTHRGGIEITTSSYGAFIAQSTVFNTDGLNILCRKGIASFANEYWEGWNDKSGYTDNGADRLIDKGFRYYTVTVNDSVKIDVYIVHMDAECDEGSQAARESNMRQVANAVLKSNNRRPILIMGDTNTRYNRDRVKECIIDAISADPRFECRDVWVEHCWNGQYRPFVAPADGSASITVGDPYYGYQHGEVVDKIFYVNNTDAPYFIQAEYYLQDTSFVNEQGEPLADHWPVVSTFSYYPRPVLQTGTNRQPNEVQWNGQNPMQGGDYFIYHPYSGQFLSIVNGALALTADSTTIWTMTPDNNAMTMVGSGLYFYLNRTGTPGFYSAEPKLSADKNTLLVAASTTSAEYGAYKLYRTKDVTRYLNNNGSVFSAAKTLGEQNDWVFITRQQYRDSVSYTVYDEVNVPVVPNPGYNAMPGLQGTTSIDQVENDMLPATGGKYLYRGQLYLRHGDSLYDLTGRKCCY